MEETWENASISGVHVRMDWSRIEPTPGQFDFDELGRELDRAVAHGKLYAISVRAGRPGTPSWIFDHGVARLSLQDASDSMGNRTEQCGPMMDLGSPTDPAFAALHQRMMRALADFVRSRADWYRALAWIRPGGANLFSAENRLPNSCKPGCVCNTEVFARAGYRPSKLYAFYADEEADLAERFPEKAMSYQLIQAGFPRIDERGCWQAGNEDDHPRTQCPDGTSTPGMDSLPGPTEQTEKILDHGLKTWGSRFQVQHNGLSPTPTQRCPSFGRHPAIGPYKGADPDCPNPYVLRAGVAGPGQLTGFQTNNTVRVGTPELLDSALSNAWESSDATYVEIYEEVLWQAIRAQASGRSLPSGHTIQEWDALFRQRRARTATGSTPDPFPATVQHTFHRSGKGPTTIHYGDPTHCGAGTATIIVDP